ncbi:acyltransferase [Candidatus Gottesmanbacteria bacterium]|nr:acyltransferase [Candidatus Gottesmanbacteria bacterium]
MKDRMGNQLSADQIIQKASNRFGNYLLDFELMLLRFVGHIPFSFIRKFIYRISGVRIGKGSTIHMWCNFFNPYGVSIGEDTIIGDHAFLDGRAKLTIGNHVDIGSSVLIYNSEHDVDAANFTAIEEPVVIEDYVYIGARVTILPGVKIQKGAVVASGAVVTKDVVSMSIVGGVPAKEIRIRKLTKLEYKLGRARLFQ